MVRGASLRCNGCHTSLRLAEAAVSDRPRHADILRSDLSQSLCSERGGAKKKEQSVTVQRGRCAEPKAARPRMDRIILDIVSVRERPAEAEDELCRPLGGRPSYRSKTTRTSRHSSSATAASNARRELPRKDTTTVVAALAKHIRKLPSSYDVPDVGPRQGDALRPQALHVATEHQLYFCDPRSPWAARQARRTPTACCDSTSRIGTDLSRFSQTYLNSIALHSINARERPWASKPPR